MLKPLFAVLLFPLFAPFVVGSAGHRADDYHEPAAALVEDTQSWLQRTNLWHLVARGESLRGRVKIEVVKSNLVEAWICGAQKICLSTRLLEVFSPEEQQAVLAHELGHLLIPRRYDAHPQLWEAQCDLFAVALLRDMELVKQMLVTLGNDCRTCSDAEHPLPAVRAALLDRLAALALTKVHLFDHLRSRDFTVQFKHQKKPLPAAWRRLNFAIQPRTRVNQPLRPQWEQALRFPVDFPSALRPRLSLR
jgi:Zn-dependent peptidase ImmA (M78 family)